MDTSATASQPPAPSASPAPPSAAAFESDFSSFYQATLDPLRRYLSRILRSRHDAQDIAHDAYLKVYEAAKTKPVAQPSAYLFTTAQRLAFRYHERRASRVRPSEDSVLEANMPLADGTAELVMGAQDAAALHDAVEALPRRCRDVVILRYFENLSYAEIAAYLKISQSAVEKQVVRASRLLREKLGQSPR